MGQPITSLKKSTKTQSGADMPGFVKEMAYSVQSSANQRQRVQTVTSTNNKYQKRNRFGDQFTTLNGDNLEFSISDSKGNLITRSLASDISGFLSYQTGTVAPTVATNFPEDGNWGWYLDTVTGYMYLPRNVSGTLYNITISTLAGTITGAQHGNLNAFVGTMHAMGQISGTLSAAQHGDLSAAVATFHSFSQIGSTITAGQHGNLAGGALHSAASGAANGFMSTTHYNLVNGATASATADTLCLRDASGNVNGAAIEVAGTKVVGARNTGWTAPTATQSKAGFANGASATEIEQNLSAVINALITHGLLGA